MLFLSAKEIDQLLGYVKKVAAYHFIYPMFVFVGHNGCRRSEALRAQMDDPDFDGGIVRIREKKRDRSVEITFRHVPISPLLAKVMRDWISQSSRWPVPVLR